MTVHVVTTVIGLGSTVYGEGSDNAQGKPKQGDPAKQNFVQREKEWPQKNKTKREREPS